MKKIIKSIRSFKESLRLNLSEWAHNKYNAPSPHHIKQMRLLENGIPNAVWIETGTFMGDTTNLLSKSSRKVYSIEPEPILFAKAKKRFHNQPSVEIINGCSEDIFPTLLSQLSGDVNFWLDGHYSAGFTYKGKKDTPIVEELDSIIKNKSNFSKIAVLIDDVRCFNPDMPEFSHYPKLDYLVDWARLNNFKWHIEHDIFVAKNF